MQNGPQLPREVFFRPDDGGYLHSVLTSREAMSAVPEIWRRYGASISGAHRRIKSANFADLERLRSAPRTASRPIEADVQASGLPQAAARGTLNALAVETFNDLLKKHGKRQNVENPLLD
jgi:predicted outer membrane lipoprotein